MGVLNVDHGYVHRPDQVKWIAGAQEAVRRLNDLGYRVVVVSNQAGVGHGYYKEEDIVALHSWMQDQLASKGAFIDAFYYCMHHPDARIEKYRGDHINRKPGPGMILQAFFGSDDSQGSELPDRRQGKRYRGSWKRWNSGLFVPGRKSRYVP